MGNNKPFIAVISQASFTAINRSIYRRLQTKGWRIEMIVPQRLHFPTGIKEAEKQLNEDPPIHFLPLIRKNPRLQWYQGLEALLEKMQPECVYLDNDPASYMAMRLGKWCNKHRKKFVTQSCENLSQTFVDVYKRAGFGALFPAILKNYFSWVSKKYCNHVFTINNDGTKLFKKAGYRSVSKIPLGFDEQLFFPNERIRLKLRKELGLEQVTFAYFGRLVQEKGVDILVKSLSNLMHYKWHLMMDRFDSYSSTYANEVERLIQEIGIKNRITYIHANHIEIAAYMNAADVIILPSVTTPKWKEQYGRVIPEAMACGKIVIGAQTGAIPELIDNAGILFPEGDIASLQATIEKIILNNKAYAPLKEKAYKRAHDELGIEAQADKIHRCFSRLLA